MRCLMIGDVHARKEDLDDVDRLMTYCLSLSFKTKSIPVFLGDQHHHHGMVSAEVMDFYYNWFKRSWYAKPIVMVGNHDMVLGTKIHTMLPYAHDVRVVDGPTVIENVIFSPYLEDISTLVDFCNTNKECGSLVFHATVDGAEYDNGFPARDGVDQNLFPQKNVVSGHIHRPGTIGKVHYVGGPRWLTTSDANTDRAVWAMEFDGSGNLISKEPYTTNTVCRQILRFEDTEASPLDPSCIDQKHSNTIDIHGSAGWVDSRAELFSALGCKVRAYKTQQTTNTIRESEGVDIAFNRFCDAFKPEYGTSIGVLKEIVEKRLHGL